MREAMCHVILAFEEDKVEAELMCCPTWVVRNEEVAVHDEILVLEE
jgi:hypothetical protein